MKSGIKILWVLLCVWTAFFLFSRVAEMTLYPSYSELYDYRRFTPELFPSDKVLKVTAIWHDTTYADLIWVNFIQSVGDNAGNDKYLDFSHAMLSNITSLSPYFTRAYETDLLFTPLVFADSQSGMTADDRMKIERAIELGKKWMETLCDQEKLDTISSLPYGKVLWERKDLRNSCLWGKIPYYIGFHYANDFEDGEKASYYYKIASMQDDAPRSSVFLGPLALANTSQPLDAAISFFLIARDGFDAEPFACHGLTESLLRDIQNKRPLDEAWIAEIQAKERLLQNPKDISSLESLGVGNCYDSLRRGIKQVFIAYIDAKSQEYTDITDARDLVKNGVIKEIPTIASQSWFTLRKREGKWFFRSY
jgi:hypothetical protein